MQLPGLLMPDLDVIFCGIKPTLSAARAGHHFSHRNHRFWRVVHQAGFTPHLIHTSEILTAEERCREQHTAADPAAHCN
jgi:G:T/U-mismatch repair DNA glycosylase